MNVAIASPICVHQYILVSISNGVFMEEFHQSTKQFPVRLSLQLSDSLDRIAKKTNISKTTISRIAIQKFIAELENSGVSDTMKEVCSI